MKVSKVFSWHEQISLSIAWGHHFLILNILLTCLIGLTYVYAAPETESFVAFVYLILTWLGQLSFIAFALYICLFFPLCFVMPFRFYRPIAVLLAIAADVVLLADAKMYLAVKAHISPQLIRLFFGDLDFHTGLNFNFMLIALPLLLVCQTIFAKISTKELYLERRPKAGFILGAAALCTFAVSHCLYAWADAVNYDAVVMLRSVYPAQYPMTAKTFLKSHGWISAENRRTWDPSAFVYPLTTIEAKPLPQARGLVFVNLNGLSYDELSAKTTPGLLELKNTYHSFENHYLPYHNRSDNLFAVAFGMHRRYKGSLQKAGKIPVIAEEMLRQGYELSILTNSPSFPGDKDALVISGLRQAAISRHDNCKEMFDHALELIKGRPEGRRFGLNLSLDLKPEAQAAEHEACLAAADSALSSFVAALQQENLLKGVMVIITSLQSSHSLTMSKPRYDPKAAHVPLIIIWPDGSCRGVAATGISSHFDLAPSIGTQLLGIVNPTSEYTTGANLAGMPERQYFVTTDERGSLLLIAPSSFAIYRRDGQFRIFQGAGEPLHPVLEDLIKAIREINHFEE